MRRVWAAVLLLSPAPAAAQPIIESLLGDATQNGTLVLRGSGFGARPPTPLAFDDFERNAEGDPVAAPWTAWTELDGQEPVVDSGARRRNSTRALLCDFSGENGESSFGLAIPPGEVYVSFYQQVRHTGSFTRSFGQLRILGGSARGNPRFAHALVDGHTAEGQWLAGSSDEGCTLDQSSYGGLGDGIVSTNRWIRHEYWLRESQPNARDGWMEIWRDRRQRSFRLFSAEQGAVVPVGPSVATRCSTDGWAELRMGQTWAHDPGGDAAILYDDVYVDVTPSRVEIGNSPVWQSVGAAEVQPSTAWSDTEIAVTVHVGTFMLGSTYWLFVFDGENVPSEGFPVDLGASYEEPEEPDGGAPDAAVPPETTRGGCSCGATPAAPTAIPWIFLAACLYPRLGARFRP